jgi:hypothetical protein
MKIVTVAICDWCGLIIEPGEGFIITGNITKTPKDDGCGGLVGNNFPHKYGEMFHLSEINQSVYCEKCILKVLFPNNEVHIRGDNG